MLRRLASTIGRTRRASTDLPRQRRLPVITAQWCRTTASPKLINRITSTICAAGTFSRSAAAIYMHPTTTSRRQSLRRTTRASMHRVRMNSMTTIQSCNSAAPTCTHTGVARRRKSTCQCRRLAGSTGHGPTRRCRQCRVTPQADDTALFHRSRTIADRMQNTGHTGTAMLLSRTP